MQQRMVTYIWVLNSLITSPSPRHQLMCGERSSRWELHIGCDVSPPLALSTSTFLLMEKLHINALLFVIPNIHLFNHV